jgi:hypothetical protein
MGKFRFVPFEERAKKLGLSAAAFRAKMLTDNEWCWVYVSHFYASGSQEKFLPAYDPETSPFARWEDEASCIEKEGATRSAYFRRWGRYQVPSYYLSGWVVICPTFVESVLVGHETGLGEGWVGLVVRDSSST